jgi:hypothetical protein
LLGNGHLTGPANRRSLISCNSITSGCTFQSAISRPSFVLCSFSSSCLEINTPKGRLQRIRFLQSNYCRSLPLVLLWRRTLAPLVVIRSGESDFLLFFPTKATNGGKKSFRFRRGGAQSEATPGCMPNDELLDATTFLFSFGSTVQISDESLNKLRGWSSGWKERVPLELNIGLALTNY